MTESVSLRSGSSATALPPWRNGSDRSAAGWRSRVLPGAAPPLSSRYRWARPGMRSADEQRLLGTGEPIRIVAVDDHSLLRGALCQLLHAEDDLCVVGEADTSEGLGDLVESSGAHVVLL